MFGFFFSLHSKNKPVEVTGIAKIKKKNLIKKPGAYQDLKNKTRETPNSSRDWSSAGFAVTFYFLFFILKK